MVITDSDPQLRDARSWRMNPEMFRRKKGKRQVDPALAAAQAATQVSLTSARARRDKEYRKLREEGGVVRDLREIRSVNHLAELAIRALRRNGHVS